MNGLQIIHKFSHESLGLKFFKTGYKITFVQDDDGWMPLAELNMYCHIIRSSNDNSYIAYVCIYLHIAASTVS